MKGGADIVYIIGDIGHSMYAWIRWSTGPIGSPYAYVDGRYLACMLGTLMLFTVLYFFREALLRCRSAGGGADQATEIEVNSD